MTRMEAVAPYIKDHHFENVLSDFNEALYPLELKYISQFQKSLQHPIIFIVGTQRSGTTLLMQLLISYFKLGYVNNLMARFWKVPYIGAMLTQELKRKQIPQQPLDFVSELGTTYGYDGPHEFGYFWSHWFPHGETHETSDEDLLKMDTDLFCQELAAIENVFSAPLVFKNPVVASLNMSFLANIFPTAFFLICERIPLYVAQSTLQARIKFHGDKTLWWSFKPKEYLWLRDHAYPKQIAGQIYFTEQRIKHSLSKIASQQYLRIKYENLCSNPEKELTRVGALVTKAGYSLTQTGYKPKPFQCSNIQKIDKEEFKLLQRACEYFYDSKGTISS